MSETTTPHASDAPHDEHHVHVYEHSGLREGNAKVPAFLIAAIVALLGFFAWYIVTQWSAQPSTARVRTN